MGNALSWNSSRRENERMIAETRKRREKRFEQARVIAEQLDGRKRDEILSLGLVDLRDALHGDVYSPAEVVRAYGWKALQAQEKLNCLQEFLLEAFDEADALGKLYAGREDKPPLYGIPFSVKGNFFVKGYDCCIGLSHWLNKPASEDCTLVAHLRNKGAVPFVITNVPQLLYAIVCSNPVYGLTLNPHDPKRSPGGSSGGEACLLAAGGTPFGTGSDIAGSLRIPSIFCGTTSLKPTQERLIVNNLHGGLPGRGRLALGYGFFTNCVEDQALLLEHTLGNDDYRRLVLKNAPVPFRSEVVREAAGSRSLRIGYFLSDGFVPPTPGFARVTERTVEKLKELGHELVLFTVPEPNRLASLFFNVIFPEGGAYFRSQWAKDIVDEHLKPFANLLRIPNFVKWLASLAIGPFSPQAAIMCSSYNSTPVDVRRSQADYDDYVEQFVNKWQQMGLDALVCPAFTVPALEHHWPSKLGCCCLSTALFNMVDFPAGVVPAGVISKEDDEQLRDESKWPVGRNLILKQVRSASLNAVGLPLSVQVATLPYEEEKCLGVMKQVEEIWKEENAASHH